MASLNLNTGRVIRERDIESLVAHYFPGLSMADDHTYKVRDPESRELVKVRRFVYIDHSSEQVLTLSVSENNPSVISIDGRPQFLNTLRNNLDTIETALREEIDFSDAVAHRALKIMNRTTAVFILREPSTYDHFTAFEEHVISGRPQSVRTTSVESADKLGSMVERTYEIGRIQVTVSMFILTPENRDSRHEDSFFMIVRSNSSKFIDAARRIRASFLPTLSSILHAIRSRRTDNLGAFRDRRARGATATGSSRAPRMRAF